MKKIILLMMMTMFFSGTVFAKKIYLDSVHDKCVSIIKTEWGTPVYKNSCNFAVHVVSCLVSGGTLTDREYRKCGKNRFYYAQIFRLSSDTYDSSKHIVLLGSYNDHPPAFKVKYFACEELDSSGGESKGFWKYETVEDFYERRFERRGDKGDGVCYTES